MASERNQKCGILDNDYKAAFDYMVLKWVFKVLIAKGIDKEVVNRFYSGGGERCARKMLP